MLRDLEHQPVVAILGFERVQDRRQAFFELHVDDSADDLGDFSDCVGFRGHVGPRYLIELMLRSERFGAGDDFDQ
ncbi:MAG: hypothetical protein AB7K04_11425, partial [Pseudorhodoplanes sp.]